MLAVASHDKTPGPPPSYNDVEVNSSLSKDFKEKASLSSSAIPVSSSPSAPPAYSYNAPSTYAIGRHTSIPPLVTMNQLKNHLQLLKACRELRDKVECTVIGDGPGEMNIAFEGEHAASTKAAVLKMNGPTRWAWIVGLAVERFERWVGIVQPAKSGVAIWVCEQMPPIDVLMVWHAYMLNPEWFAEDCSRLRILDTLKDLNDCFWRAINRYYGTMFNPTPESQKMWQAATKTPYDPLEAAGREQMSCREIVCPKCSQTLRVPFLTEDGTGYLQPQFQARCDWCAAVITQDYLALSKFVWDLTMDYDSIEGARVYVHGVVLAGTLRTQAMELDVVRAKDIKKAILALHKFKKSKVNITRQQWRLEIHERMNNSVLETYHTILGALKISGGRLPKQAPKTIPTDS